MKNQDIAIDDSSPVSMADANVSRASIVKLTLAFVICFLGTLSSGIVTMLMSVYLPVTVKDLLGNVSEERLNDVSAWINCVFIFGWMFGGIIWGFVSDKIGRSLATAVSIASFGLFAVLTGVSSSWLLICICRFLSGFGIGGLMVSSTVLVAELWSARSRAIVLGIVNVAMPVGFFIAGAINNATENWRTAFWIGGVPLLLGIAGYFVLPESGKWKTNKPGANAIIEKEIFSAGNRKNLLTGSIVFGAMLIGLWAVFSWAPTWVQSISTAAEAQEKRGSTIMILSMGGIAGSFVSGWIVNLLGVRKTMLMCFLGCFVLTLVVFKTNYHITTVTFGELAALAFFFGISQGALSVYIPSLFPVNVCASATGFCFNVGRLFTGTVVFFIGALVSFLGGYGNAVVTFSFVFIIGMIATWMGSKSATSDSQETIGITQELN
jgi:MFS family permease